MARLTGQQFGGKGCGPQTAVFAGRNWRKEAASADWLPMRWVDAVAVWCGELIKINLHTAVLFDSLEPADYIFFPLIFDTSGRRWCACAYLHIASSHTPAGRQ